MIWVCCAGCATRFDGCGMRRMGRLSHFCYYGERIGFDVDDGESAAVKEGTMAVPEWDTEEFCHLSRE